MSTMEYVAGKLKEINDCQGEAISKKLGVSETTGRAISAGIMSSVVCLAMIGSAYVIKAQIIYTKGGLKALGIIK